MLSQIEMREKLVDNLEFVIDSLNSYLRGENVEEIKTTLERLGRGGKLPHWYQLLAEGQSMPNLDGKTIGSVIEMTLVATFETKLFRDSDIPDLNLNPAKGVDIPTMNLGIKSPSENYCTSEPFYSSYERLLGNDHDNLVLLTDYQSAKKRPPPVQIQIKASKYLRGSQIADKSLCSIAKLNRDYTLKMGEASAMKYFQFLCYVNQSSWRAKQLLKLCNAIQAGEKRLLSLISEIEADFISKSIKAEKEGKSSIDEYELQQILLIKDSNDLPRAIINAASDWVSETLKDASRMPNANEWDRYLASPLDGEIGMSFALQWRYNFGPVFK